MVRFHSYVGAVVALLLLLASTPTDAFRFTLTPGKIKCFTNEIQEPGRYEFRYRMVRSLSPFVSISVTSPGGRVLLEHEVAKPDAKEILALKKAGTIGICFNTAPKAKDAATSLNVTLDIIDAEDAELTRMKKQSYTTSSPIALGAGKGSAAMQQMQYIFKTVIRARMSLVSLMRVDEDMRYAMAQTESQSWKAVYAFVFISAVITLATFVRLRMFMSKRKIL